MDKIKQKKLPVSSIKQKKLIVSRFEDLSNELLYEIFDYIDSCYIYETFSNLNNRFYHLIIHSSLPLKLHFSLLSKATFQHRCTRILIPNIHRIISLHLSHHLLIEHFFTTFSLNSLFIRLEMLTLNNIKCDHLISILTTLTSLPRLFSLTIISIEKIRCRDMIYYLIIRLPVLKYCKLTIDIWNENIDLLLNNTEYSPIEHLIIDTKCKLGELIELLAYTPQLNRLSCKISTLNSSLSQTSVIPTNLMNICLRLEDTSFDEFEWFISSFAHQLQVLGISTERDIEFLNADRWKRLISRQMPLLRRFYFQYQMVVQENSNDQNRYHLLMDKFNSSFWTDRQWFFAHQHYKPNYFTSSIRFHSIKPYRWDHYEFHQNTCQHHHGIGLNLANEVDLKSCESIVQSSMNFPRTTRLVNVKQSPSLISDLTRIFSPIQLTELVISCEKLRFEQLHSLLHHFSNIQSLTIPTSILYLSSPRSETSRLTFNKTNITKVTILHQCTLTDIQILIRFCPYIQSLEIQIDKDNLEFILRFLLSRNTNQYRPDLLSISSYLKKNITVWKQEYTKCIHCTKNESFNSLPCNHHLSLLCCRDVNYRMIEKFRTIIDQETLLNDYSIEYFDEKMYLWW